MKILQHPEEWERGAIGLQAGDMADGLLFAMPKTAPWPVTMAAVMIPLDVYWLSGSGMVLEHAELFPGMPVYWPTCQTPYILELPMDREPRYRVGDFVELPP